MATPYHAIPDGFHGSLLMAAFHLLLDAGFSADESSPDADFMQPTNDATAPAAPTGFTYACTYPILDDVSPGCIHAYVSHTTRQRVFIGAVHNPFND